MTKKLENMTSEERITYWAKEQEKERKERQKILDKLSPEMLDAVYKLQRLSLDVAHDALYESTPKYISCQLFHDLHDASCAIRNLFNIDRN